MRIDRTPHSYFELSPARRRVHDLTIDGYSVREIAKAMGTTTQNVYKLQKRLRRDGWLPERVEGTE